MNDTYNIRYRSLVKVSGWLLLLESALMLVPLLLCLLSGHDDWRAFLISVLVAGSIGALAVACNRNVHTRLYRREGYLLISFIWIIFSLFGMIPFMLCDHPLGLADAFFETMSGFTTTGATVIADVESMGHGILLWRAVIQWIGGLGIVLFLIALLPALNDTGGIALFNAEITGISHDKLHPQIRKTAVSLWMAYSLLTVMMIPLLMAGGMNFFDSVCHAMTTLSTGGFSTRNLSIAAWDSPVIALTVSFFMLVGGVNFVILYDAFNGQFRRVVKNDVLRMYLLIVGCASVIISLSFVVGGQTGSDRLVIAPLFHVSSAITSTGFTYSGFASWGSPAIAVTMLLMVCGACAGSTTGGIKADRVTVLFKNLRNEIVYTLFPRHMKSIDVGGKCVDEKSLIRVMAFISLYLLIIVAGALLMTFCGYTVGDSFFASASCMGNNGLGLGATGYGYGSLPDLLKWFFSFQMLVGRLEIFTVFVLLYPSFWKR